MFYTVASILITVVTLLFGVGYIVYKNIIQMIKNLDEKYECRLQIKLSEINTKFNETITLFRNVTPDDICENLEKWPSVLQFVDRRSVFEK